MKKNSKMCVFEFIAENFKNDFLFNTNRKTD